MGQRGLFFFNDVDLVKTPRLMTSILQVLYNFIGEFSDPTFEDIMSYDPTFDLNIVQYGL